MIFFSICNCLGIYVPRSCWMRLWTFMKHASGHAVISTFILSRSANGSHYQDSADPCRSVSPLPLILLITAAATSYGYVILVKMPRVGCCCLGFSCRLNMDCVYSQAWKLLPSWKQFSSLRVNTIHVQHVIRYIWFHPYPLVIHKNKLVLFFLKKVIRTGP